MNPPPGTPNIANSALGRISRLKALDKVQNIVVQKLFSLLEDQNISARSALAT